MQQSDPHHAQTKTHDVLIDTGKEFLDGVLEFAPDSRGIVVFAQGREGGRNGAQDRRLASLLRQNGLATLLVDLVTRAEAGDTARAAAVLNDRSTLSERLVGVVHWLRNDPRTRGHRVGLIGQTGGGPVALSTAAAIPYTVCAVVSRDGTIEHPPATLAEILAPTLLIVGEHEDAQVLEQNRRAEDHLSNFRLAVVPGAGTGSEQPGELEAVAELAADWFGRHLVKR